VYLYPLIAETGLMPALQAGNDFLVLPEEKKTIIFYPDKRLVPMKMGVERGGNS